MTGRRDAPATAQPAGERPPGPAEAALGAFLAAARRRYLLRSMLAIAAGSGACGLLYTFGSRVLHRLLRIELPGFSVGLALFFVLAVVGFRGARLARVAREADRRLRLHDRLATFLDFGARADVAPEFRAAQAREAAAALRGVDAARGIAVPRLLWAAPLIFAWLLYVDFFEFFTPFSMIFQAPGRGVALRRAADRQRGAEGPDREAPEAVAPTTRREAEPPSPERPPEKREPPPEPGATAEKDEGEGEKSAQEPAEGAPAGSSPAPVVFAEPPQLYSEPVSRELTPVGDASGGGGASAPAGLDLPPRGRISFDIVPTEGAGDGAGGAGGPGGGKAGGLRITIDYDAVPAEYRFQVRRYFNALVRLFQGGTDGA